MGFKELRTSILRTHILQNLQDRISFSAASLREIHRISIAFYGSRPFCGIQRTGRGDGVKKVGYAVRTKGEGVYKIPKYLRT